jgi:phosphate acetyltransferase
VANEQGLNLSGLPIEDAADSYESAERAVALVGEGKAEALMKGSLHTDVMMSAVVKHARAREVDPGDIERRVG